VATLDDLEAALSAGDLSLAASAFDELIASPKAFGSHFNAIRQVFERHGRLPALLDLSVANDGADLYFGTLIDIVELACLQGREGVASTLIERSERRASPMSWGEQPAGRGFRGPPEVYARLIALKYAEVPALDDITQLTGNAERVADRISLPEAPLNYIYPRHGGLETRPAWERDLRVAAALDHITNDVHFGRRILDVVDLDGWEANLTAIADERGLLVLTYHGGFKRVMVKLFDFTVATGTFLGAGQSGSKRIGAGTDSGAALFACLRWLQDGGILAIAPDARSGNLDQKAVVFGRAMRVGSGAAFIAYEARSPTAFYTVVREGDVFKPLLVAGPRCEPGEKYPAFRERLFKFYSAQIEAILTGYPKNIVLGARWVKRLI
jgi:hypothetical protein